MKTAFLVHSCPYRGAMRLPMSGIVVITEEPDMVRRALAGLDFIGSDEKVLERVRIAISQMPNTEIAEVVHM